jgi:hypothetical protein
MWRLLCAAVGTASHRTTLSGQQFLSFHLIRLRIFIFPSAADF